MVDTVSKGNGQIALIPHEVQNVAGKVTGVSTTLGDAEHQIQNAEDGLSSWEGQAGQALKTLLQDAVSSYHELSADAATYSTKIRDAEQKMSDADSAAASIYTHEKKAQKYHTTKNSDEKTAGKFFGEVHHTDKTSLFNKKVEEDKYATKSK